MKPKIYLLLFFATAFLTVKTYAYTGKVIKSFATPGNFPTGLTFDGKNIWLADRKTDKLYCINPNNGKVVREIPSPGYWPLGLTWDGEYLWNIDLKAGTAMHEFYEGKVYKIDPKDGTILSMISAPSKTPTGLAFDGKYLWCVDNRKDMVYQFDPNDGTTIIEFPAPATDPQGITFDGKYLWISDRIHDEIYMLDPETGHVILVADAPGKFTRGITCDSECLWAVDYQYDKIYQLERESKNGYRKTNPRKAKVIFSHQAKNFGPGKVKSLDVHLAVPTDGVNQSLREKISYKPEPNGFVEDRWGQKTAYFHRENIAAGETDYIEAIYEFTTYNVRYFIFPDRVGDADDISNEIKNKYLENNNKYQINHIVIRQAVDKLTRNESNLYWKARNIYQYLIEKMEYEMVGGWNTAPTVLERGNGSCSEYTFVFISMCRAAGIPARYVGSVVVRGDAASHDEVFHRWAEIYLPNYGWIPIDVNRGDRPLPREHALGFGSLSNRLFITTQSGGGSKTMSWNYNANQFYITEPQTFLNIEYFAEWEPVE